ncbi:MAG: hypothetical protein KAT33_03305 [Bacteroidales bacterium]|nr:hypothetical protein [Bacteroidales bacterium]
MNEILIIIIFLAWYILSLVISENIGKSRKIGTEWSFFFCMVLSPVIGIIITLVSTKINKSEAYRNSVN